MTENIGDFLRNMTRAVETGNTLPGVEEEVTGDHSGSSMESTVSDIINGAMEILERGFMSEEERKMVEGDLRDAFVRGDAQDKDKINELLQDIKARYE